MKMSQVALVLRDATLRIAPQDEGFVAVGQETLMLRRRRSRRLEARGFLLAI